MSRFVGHPDMDTDEDKCGAKGWGVMPAYGAILLGLGEMPQHLATIHISCNFCPRRGKANVGRLMQEHGPDMPIPDLLRLMSADCPRRLAARIRRGRGLIGAPANAPKAL